MDRQENRYFLQNLPLGEALERWQADRTAAGCPEQLESIRLELSEALGLATAEPIWATTSSPPFDAAAMDGIAVSAKTTIGASETAPLRLTEVEYAPVDTGDPLPDHFDAVVMREYLHFVAGGVELRAAVAPHTNVRSIGEDVVAGELLFPQGHRLRAVDLAAIAAGGATDVLVHRRPVVAILPTGDELKPIGVALAPGELRDTNSLMLAGQSSETGAEARRFPIVADDPDALAEAVLKASEEADLVLVLAGSSAGRGDYTASVLERVGTVSAHGVAVKPGHPVVLGVVSSTPAIGVPGYPVSAALTFDLIARPLLAELQQTSDRDRPHARAQLARKLPSTIGMEDWIRVRLGRVGGRLVAAPLSRAAGVLTSLTRADGLLCVPREKEGYDAGASVDVELLRPLTEIEKTIVAVGSHDLVLDLLGARLRARDPEATLASANVGSLGGLVALREGLCHVAGSHLLDPETGEYTLPYVATALGLERAAVVRLAHRDQGLIVPPGNPLELTGIEDLGRSGVRYVNRQRGAGTRVLLDAELARLGLDPSSIDGYEREEHTHLNVAAAVAAGRADCGVGVLAAARAFGLDFVPVTSEPYDLVFLRERLDDPLTAPLLALLEEPEIHQEIEALGGYDTRETGQRVH